MFEKVKAFFIPGKPLPLPANVPKSRIYGSTENSPYTDEGLSELVPPASLKKFRLMADNEPVIGGLLTRFTNIFKSAQWEITGPNANLVKKQLTELPHGFSSFMEDLSTAFIFGFSLNEKIWDVRDGKVILVDLAPRYQMSIDSFVSEKGETYTNQVYARQSTMEKGQVDIPLQKCVHFVPYTRARNPWGRSLLRPAYKPYYYKSQVEASEAQSIDRNLSGLPVMTAPEGFDFTQADSDSPTYNAAVAATLTWAESIVSKVRRDEIQGVVKPAGWTIELLKSENTITVDSPNIIARYNAEMAVVLLQSFIIASGTAKGTNEKLMDEFRDACNDFLATIANLINRSIVKDICEFNLKTTFPVLKFYPVSKEALQNLGSFVARLVDNGIIEPTKTLEKSMLRRVNIDYTEDDRKPRLKDKMPSPSIEKEDDDAPDDNKKEID